MDGVLNFYKPTGISSARAVDIVRRLTRQRKSGHAGALDPSADGVLVVCLGAATKLVERWMDQPKVYCSTARLDVTSASLDADRPLEPVAVSAPPSEAALREAARRFEGTIQQAPPAISAIKVAGRRAYELERRGAAPDLPPRPVHIYWLHMLRYEWPELDFEVACGRGMYVRSLIRDWGAAASVGGCLMTLTRTRVGPFTLDTAWSEQRMAALPDVHACLMPLETARSALQQVTVPAPD